MQKTSAFSISQEDIDAILLQGNNVSGGKFRIFEQFQKQASAAENATFLKDEYGVGGTYPASPGRKLDEWHDPSGLQISRGSIGAPDATVTLSWRKVEKRIGELIAADRYLSPAEKEKYPAYLRSKAAHEARWKIAKEFRSIVYDYNDFQTQLGQKEKCLELYPLSTCWNAFGCGEKKMSSRKTEGEFVLPLMREAMEVIIGEDTHLTERCKKVLEDLKGPLAAPLEPTYDELNPPPKPPKEYRLSLGDTVHLGTQEYEIIALGPETVRLYDPAFPLFNKDLSRQDFDRMLAENPLNDSLSQAADKPPAAAESVKTDTLGYDLGYGFLGNGVTVWNRKELRYGDYKTIAHIDSDRKVAFYEDSLPEEVRAEIEEYAAKSNMTVSATQDSLVFHTPPVEEPPQKTKPDILGQEVQIEDRRYIVDSLDRTGGTVSLRDVTFQDGTGFPIFRVESIARVREWLEPAEEETFPPATPDRTAEMLQQAQLANELSQQTGQMVFAFEEGNAEPVNLPEKRKELLAPPAPKPRARVSPFVIHPEVPNNQRQNFYITDDHLGEGGPKVKFQYNFTAIQTLQQIEAEGRLATPEEQEVLSRYVGWGGLPMAFDEKNGAWADEYRKLRAILPADEYEAARASTLNAHYTSPVVIRAIYQGLERLGFKTGNILEPSCGIGNFFGMLPETMANSKLYGEIGRAHV